MKYIDINELKINSNSLIIKIIGTFIMNNNFIKLFNIVFWGGYLLLGILIFKDYGVTWDESFNRLQGFVSLKYVLIHLFPFEFAQGLLPNIDTIPELKDFFDRNYGVLFQLPCALFEVIFCKDNLVSAYQAKHLFLFFSVFIGLFTFHLSIKKLFNSTLLAYTAVLFFILSPRFFAESFNNTKDIVLVAFVFINLYTICRYLDRNSTTNLLLHALSTAFVIDVRINGVVYFATFVGILAVQGILSGAVKQALKQIGTYCVSSFCFTVVFFPYLWSHTFRHLKEVFENMSKFRWDGLNLVNGEFVRSTELTTTYIPEWIVVTLPFFVLLPFVIGLCYFIALSLSKIRTNWRELNNKIFLLLLFSAVVLFGSIFSIIVLNSTLYNGWRQVYFLYPEIIVFAVFGIKRLIQSQNTISKYFSRIVFLFCTANAIWSGLFIINNHPYQNVYFNALAKQPLKDNYDLDYWGGATHLALEHLLKLENGPVFYCHESAIPDTGTALFSSNELNRLKQVPCDLAKYRINNFTAFSKDNIRLRNLEGNRVKSFYVDGDQVFLEILEGYRPFEESLKSLISTDQVEQTASFKDLKANLDQISVDSVDFADQKHKVIDVKGWFFDKAITTSDQSYRVIVLSNNSDTVIVRVRDDFRPDVGNHFGDSNLYNCGFKTLIDMRDLAGKWDLFYGVKDHTLLYKSDKVTEVNL